MNTVTRIVCLGLMLTAPTTALGQEWASKMFETTSHDFGAVARGSKTEFHFSFKNLYKEDVHVAAVRSSCGCTTPSVTESTLKTFETSAVVAKFNTTSFSGTKAATITVVFDRPYYAEVRLQVSGYIRTDVIVEPAEVAFGEVVEGTEKEVALTVTRRGRLDWKIEDVRSQSDDLAVRLGEPKRTGNAVQYPLVVRMKESMPIGELREHLTLVTNEPTGSKLQLAVSGRVRPILTVNPFAWNLGALQPESSTEKRLMVRGDEPFELEKVICDDERFTFEVPSGSKKIHFVKAKFAAGEEPGKISQQIRIVSNLPGERATQLLVTGEVKATEVADR